MGIILTKNATSGPEWPSADEREEAVVREPAVPSAYGAGRITRSRKVIAQAAAAMTGAFTVEELAAAVRNDDRTAGATATVYRAVAAMEAAGFVERVGSLNGSALLAVCSADSHHHHIVCDSCGRVATAPCPVLPEVADAMAATGFSITRHEVTLYGLCPMCAAESEH
jgi:Fur family ferric uptake transcriptional regulator